VSELFALDAPSRPLVATAFMAHGVLMLAFGAGVWLSAGYRRSLRIPGGLLMGYALAGMTGPLFFSMHAMVRGGGTQAMQPGDVMHIILTAMLVLLILLSLGVGATAFGTPFRLYSIGTILIVLVFGALAGLQGGNMAANLPTPWMGVEEHFNIFGYMLWVVVLTIALLRAPGAIAPRRLGKPTVTSQETPQETPQGTSQGTSQETSQETPMPVQPERVPVASHR
jgi:hypothetical protein